MAKSTAKEVAKHILEEAGTLFFSKTVKDDKVLSLNIKLKELKKLRGKKITNKFVIKLNEILKKENCYLYINDEHKQCVLQFIPTTLITNLLPLLPPKDTK